jgi:hypothetical protein
MRALVSVEAYIVCPYPKQDRKGKPTDIGDVGIISLDKGLHGTPVDWNVSFLLDLVLSLEPDKRKLVIGRLDAYQNEEFLLSLDRARIEELHVIESGEWKKVPRWKRILSIVMADFTAPWIFLRTADFAYLADLMKRFWYCYGGTWMFLPDSERFRIEEWRTVKDLMKYDLFPFLSKKSSQFPFLLHVVDDYRVELWFPSPLLNDILPHIESVSARHGVELSITYAER